MTQQVSEMKKHEAARDRLRATIDEVTKSIDQNEELVKTHKVHLAEKQKTVANLKKDLAEAEAKIATLEEEKKSDLNSQLSAEDRELVLELSKTLKELDHKIAECSATEETLRKKHAELTNAISVNLEKQERKLTHQSESFTYVM